MIWRSYTIKLALKRQSGDNVTWQNGTHLNTKTEERKIIKSTVVDE
jgi:hypothetical protein